MSDSKTRSERIAELETALKCLFECLESHNEAHLPPNDLAVGFWREKLRRLL